MSQPSGRISSVASRARGSARLPGTAGALLVGLSVALMAYAAPAGAGSRPAASAGAGTLLSATRIQRLSAAQVRAELASARPGPGGPVLGTGEVRYGVTAYGVRYRTENAAGHRVIASGLVVLPAGGPRSLTPVTYAHGTTATAADVPSAFGLGPDKAVEGRWAGELFASAGFAAVEPDYMGMGTGTGPIEYLVSRSEATASADLLVAARSLAAGERDRLAPGVLVTGFSQGGSAAMALGRELAAGRGYFRLRALAPVSGPYDLAGAELPGIFNGQVAPAVTPYYVAYTLTSWNRLYRLYGAPRQAFRAPYAAKVTGLFDGSHQDQQVVAALPSSLGSLLTPRYLGLLRHPAGRMLRAFEANSTCSGWTPRVPVRLFAARGDTTVTQVNAQHCARLIAARGGAVALVQVGNVDHETSDFVALPRIVRWFSRLALPARLPRLARLSG